VISERLGWRLTCPTGPEQKAVDRRPQDRSRGTGHGACVRPRVLPNRNQDIHMESRAFQYSAIFLQYDPSNPFQSIYPPSSPLTTGFHQRSGFPVDPQAQAPLALDLTTQRPSIKRPHWRGMPWHPAPNRRKEHIRSNNTLLNRHAWDDVHEVGKNSRESRRGQNEGGHAVIVSYRTASPP